MQTQREYLFSLGLTKAPTGRGRFSREGIAAIQKAVDSGMEFKSTAPVPSGKPKVVKSKSKPIVVKGEDDEVTTTGPVDSTQSGLGEAFLRYGRYDMTFEGFDADGKRHVVSGRNACSCGWSLVGHTCDNPTALINSTERIKVTPIV